MLAPSGAQGENVSDYFAGRIRSRGLRNLLRLAFTIVLFSLAFLAHAQDVVCSSNQFKVYGWGGVAWEAASASG